MFKPEFVNKWRKYAHVLRGYPYNLPESADYLEKWLDDELPARPLLDVDIVTQFVEPLPPASMSDGRCALDLAPLVSTVKLTKARGLKKAVPPEYAEATAKARYVYPLAGTLVKAHNIGWKQALVIARDLWEKSPEEELHDPLDPEIDDKGGVEVDEDEADTGHDDGDPYDLIFQ